MDNRFILTNHNVVETNSTGYFTVWNIEEKSRVFGFRLDGSTFGPLGFHWEPIQGYFDGGLENSNDVFLWSLDGEPSATSMGGGRLYAFQFHSDLF